MASNDNSANAVDVPVWDLAHGTLDSITDDIKQRINNIEHEQARLAGEYDALRGVLSRIAPRPPQGLGPTHAVNSPNPRNW